MNQQRYILKVCGMRLPENIQEIAALQPDWMGLIFHPQSPRSVGTLSPDAVVSSFPKTIKKVGVFVHQTTDEIIKIAQDWNLDIIQLHGNYSSEDCKKLKIHQLPLIKVFSPTADFEWSFLNEYEDLVDFFLFDTAGKNPGGNGFAFDWEILSNYQEKKPFLLSGGIGPDDVKKILTFKHPQCIGIDLNSRFEDEPGVKNISKIKMFIETIKHIDI
jgi:phosphoribosylanthranilate isomerase